MATQLYAEDFFDRTKLVPVAHAYCADCGRLLYDAKRLFTGGFFFLNAEEVTQCTVMEKPSSIVPPEPVIRSAWARQHLIKHQAMMSFQGCDEDGVERSYCHDCSEKIISAKCTRCASTFERQRSLIGGWACERCFCIHSETMRHITPGERVAGIVWGDQKANEHYERTFEWAEQRLVASNVLKAISGGAE